MLNKAGKYCCVFNFRISLIFPEKKHVNCSTRREVLWLCIAVCFLIPCQFMTSLGTCSLYPLLYSSFGLGSSHPHVPFLFKPGSVYWTDLQDGPAAPEGSRNTQRGLPPWIPVSSNYSTLYFFFFLPLVAFLSCSGLVQFVSPNKHLSLIQPLQNLQFCKWFRQVKCQAGK